VPLVAAGTAQAQPVGALTILPNPAVADLDGHVSFSVQGTGFPSLMDLQLSSSSLDTACLGGTTLSGQMVTADLNGRFNTSASGYDCVPGFYCVSAAELSSPYQITLACLTVEAPSSPTPTSPPITLTTPPITLTTPPITPPITPPTTPPIPTT
jgi:hypothetical protein